MAIKFNGENNYKQKIVEALKNNDEAMLQQAFGEFGESIAETVKEDFRELQASNDSAVLVQRGYRQLTSKETKWYQKVIEALRSATPKESFTAIIGSDDENDLMPTTIIEDVYKNLKEEYPLLKAIKFHYVGYLTKWIRNDHSVQKAVWGAITDEITKEITSAFKVVDVKQGKLSAFAVIENGMLDLGPVFLDGYIRACLMEAWAAGLELGIVSGTGVNDEPIGLIRDIHEGVSVSTSTGYPEKTPVPVTDFTPKSYGALVAQMSKNEAGKKKTFAKVGLIVNLTDYLTKIMPATTVLNAQATYVNNLFPFPTNVYISNAVDDGKAVLFIENEYFLAAGGQKNGVIEYDDSCKFLEDKRAFRIKQYAAGRADDNTSALYLDISNLEPAFITVKNHEVVTA